MVGALNRQLIAQNQAVPEQFEEMYKAGSGSDMRQQVIILAELCSQFRDVYVIVDALDELDAASNHQRKTLITGLTRGPSENCRLLVTSRPHPLDIKAAMEGKPRLEIAAVQSDLRL